MFEVPVLIVGGGPVGLTAAILLSQQGIGSPGRAAPGHRDPPLLAQVARDLDQWTRGQIARHDHLLSRSPTHPQNRPSALNQTDGTGQRSSLAIIASADLVQTNGL
ncbi:MAG TPA: FAD-dependent monooxygenase, partial [Gemmataceae bacterium]|nr:FAD-dependent monooxygenase [Gemmataceae bacterium]